jgi:hypothetical protein
MICAALQTHTPTVLARRENDVRKIIIAQYLNHHYFQLDTAHPTNLNSLNTRTPLREAPQNISKLAVQSNPTSYKSP